MNPDRLRLAALVALFFGSTVAQLGPCQQGVNCHLPDCFCPTWDHPYFPDVKDIPQMVYFGFDDAVTPPVDKKYQELFPQTSKNPNGCPISLSLYVQDTWTDYNLVNRAYSEGWEIASHSVNHTDVDTERKLEYQAGQQKENLHTKGFVPMNQIVGWRSPNLKPAGDAQPTVLKSLGYTYDISLTYTRFNADEKIPWPFTLDYGYPYSCAVPPCPGRDVSHQGFWEIPVNSLYDPETGYPCSYVDSCRPSSELSAFEYLWSNFQKAYTSNRAPFGLNMHAAWFFFPGYDTATKMFIEALLALPDVYIVSAKQVLDWMRTPLNVSEVHKLKGWSCDKPAINPIVTTKPLPIAGQPRPTTTTTTTTSRPSTTTIMTTTTTTTTTSSSNVTSGPHSDNLNQTGSSDQTTTTATTATTASTSPLPVTCEQGVTCSLPSCACKAYLPPGGLSLRNTPQIVYLTITGLVSGPSYQRMLSLLDPKVIKNPNGCPVSATFFVPPKNNYIPYIQSLRSRGHEIAMYGSDALALNSNGLSVVEQVIGELAEFQSLDSNMGLVGRSGGINLGYRSRSPSKLGDSLFEALKAGDVLYDASVVKSRPDVIPWPHTLDFGFEGCNLGEPSCRSQRYPALWEVPIVPLRDYKGQWLCQYADACYNRPTSVNDTFNFFSQNLFDVYNKNRAPVGIHLRNEWFSHSAFKDNLDGLTKFLSSILSRSDIYVVSIEKMLDWLRDPTGLNRIDFFDSWKC